MQPMIVARLEQVSHRYGKITALSEMTLALPAGCMVGLIAGAKRLQQGQVFTLDAGTADARHRLAPLPRPACGQVGGVDL